MPEFVRLFASTVSQLIFLTLKFTLLASYSMDSSSCPARMPVWFLSHGPGPLWLLPRDVIEPRFQIACNSSPSAEALKNLTKDFMLPLTPKAILVISAHWEEPEFTISTNPQPKLYYDYYGFPKESYQMEWPSPGIPTEVLNRVRELFKKNGIKFKEDAQRGFDHGVFVPLKLVFPDADIPVFQISLKNTLDIKEHMRLGEALSSLRNEGVLIVGSGHTTHNIGEMTPHTPEWAKKFRAWINDLLTNPSLMPSERRNRLSASATESSFSKAHPRIEHFLPIVVSAAGAGFDQGHIMYDEFILGSLLCSHFRFP